ncbi:hypothetical protein G9A89_013428 [Geosiphon pyriformis]|nr:hypothetical protein G9A89_013428 [Geosiphon pyriformis]
MNNDYDDFDDLDDSTSILHETSSLIFTKDKKYALQNDDFHLKPGLPELSSKPYDVILESLPLLPSDRQLFTGESSSKRLKQTQDFSSIKRLAAMGNFNLEFSNVEDMEIETKEQTSTLASPKASVWDTLINNSQDQKGKILAWELTGKSFSQDSDSRFLKSSYLTESNLATYEAIFHKHFSHSFSSGYTETILSSITLIQDIFYLVIGTSSKTFCYNQEQRKFYMTSSNIRIEGSSVKSLHGALSRFLAFGTHIKRLENVAFKCEKNGPLYGLTGIAFGRSLFSFITFLRKTITEIKEKSEGLENMGILKFYYILEESSLVLERLATFCCCDEADSRLTNLTAGEKDQHKEEGFYLPFGPGILSQLYRTSQEIDSSQSSLLKSVLFTFLAESSYPYFQMLSLWVGLNLSSSLEESIFMETSQQDLGDPYEEFFIARHVSNESLLRRDGDGFWQDGIRINQANPLPAFISSELANEILYAGKTLILLRDCRPNHPLCYAFNLDSGTNKGSKNRDLGWDVNLNWIFTQGEIDDMHAALQNYTREMRTAIVVQNERRRAGTERIRVHYQKSLKEIKNQADARVASRNETLRKQTKEVEDKKLEWKRSVEEFLRDRKNSNSQKGYQSTPLLEASIFTLPGIDFSSTRTISSDIENEKVISMEPKEMQNGKWHKKADSRNIDENFIALQSLNFEISPGEPLIHHDSTTRLLQHLLVSQLSSSGYKDYVLPLSAITDLVVGYPLRCQSRLINASILSILFHDLDLLAHLQVLRDFILLGNGNFVSGMTNALFNDNVEYSEDFLVTKSQFAVGGVGLKLNSRRSWPPDGIEWRMALKSVIVETILLEKKNIGDLMEEESEKITVDPWGLVKNLDDMLMFEIKNYEMEEEGCQDPQALEALDFLYLHYKPPYPLNVVITAQALTKYNRLFTFLLRILRLDTVVRHIYRLSHSRYLLDDEKDPPGQKILVQKFRFEAQQFMIALHGYVFDAAISSTWKLFMKRLGKISREAELKLSHEKQSNSRRTSTSESEAGFESMNSEDDNIDETPDIEDQDDIFNQNVQDIQSLRAYHDHILDRMLIQCLLEKKQAPIMKLLNGILSVILLFAQTLQNRRARIYDVSQRQEHWHTIQTLYEKFRLYTAMLVKILLALEEKGGGRMGLGVKRVGNNAFKGRRESNTQFSASGSEFNSYDTGKWYNDKVDHQSGVGGFLQELLLRLDFNDYYAKIVTNELSKRP